jgi:putative ABC transport system permease protein
VAFASALVLLQLGIYGGFVEAATALVYRVGGDVWAMARQVRVVDNGEVLSPGSRAIAAAHPCVAEARGLIVGWGTARKPDGGMDSVMVLGLERGRGGPVVPWSFREGLPGDLEAPFRVAVDEYDLARLRLPADHPIGAPLGLGDQTAYVAAVTSGIRSFTMAPFLFLEAPWARKILGLSDGQAQYWVLDLKDPRCAPDVIASIQRHPDLQAMTTAEFRQLTEDSWVSDSGAGAALGFGALLALIVGVVVVGQTLYAVTKEHRRELAMLKAIGATPAELTRFVGYQAGLLAIAGGGIGLGLAFLGERAAAMTGLVLMLTPRVLAVGGASIVLMCLLASLWSLRLVLTLPAAEVFR